MDFPITEDMVARCVDVVAHWWRCGGSLVEMWWLVCVDVVAHWWRYGGLFV